ncbi:hypothetical protein [Marinicella meishanensis]|uniref:hypothetical protein n=1 Tax=Marinicella meishanensis TaxID=2873263 RepID=UPI001CBD7732|nr:hypothetical protein [Marinicella sp. NBU2979]
MPSPRKFFHAISYLQYPLLLAAVGFYVPFVISLLNKQPDWAVLNHVLILFGVSLSFSTLQDTTTTQNKLSEKVWQHPTKGKVALVIIAIMAFGFMAVGLLALMWFEADQTQSVAVGLTVLGIGMLGLLKAAIEMFDNHRLDKNPQ